MLNLELLQQVRDKILFEPESHKQEVWMTTGADVKPGQEVSCPTGACVAGWASLLSGDVGIVHDSLTDAHDNLMVYDVRTPDGQVLEVSERGQELLGLDFITAETLFAEDNSTPYVLDQLDNLIAEAKEERNLA